jgi:Ca2+-binding RTX toxin-like protein
MGDGDDTFVWNPGDGSDTVEGQDGFDTMLFNGANITENVALSANGTRLRFSRDIAGIVMDVNGTERVDFTARGGADNITVGDLTGTAVTEINLNLESAPGSNTGDGSIDTVNLNATNNSDVIQVFGSGSSLSVLGLPAQINLVGSEGANDRLSISAQGGDDVIQASGLSAGVTSLTADGGEGDDILIGSAGDDLLIGGNGDDVLEGGPGTDILNGAPGNDILLQD